MAIEAIAPIILEKMIDILPRWLARHFISSQTIARQIEIDLRSINPIDISFGTEIPRLSLFFRISNLSLVNLVLDRLLIDLWVGQPTLQGAILERYDIPKRKSRDDIYFRYELTSPQQEQIRKRIKDKFLSVPITLYVKAYFESKFGFVPVEKKFEQRDVPVK